MKIRNGFVSNSSSSSFIINGNDLTALQVILIKQHNEANSILGFGIEYANYPWTIHDRGDKISGHTDMDNFSMYDFLKFIGVDMDKVAWNGAELERTERRKGYED